MGLLAYRNQRQIPELYEVWASLHFIRLTEHCSRETVINPFRGLLHLLPVFLYVYLGSCYVLYTHTSLCIQALWLNREMCLYSVLVLVWLEMYSSSLLLPHRSLFLSFFRITWDNLSWFLCQTCCCLAGLLTVVWSTALISSNRPKIKQCVI